MKVGRQYLGKFVEITWRDPGTAHVKARRREEALKGVEALALWRERGVVDDVTEGIVRLVHSEGYNAKHVDGVDEIEFYCTWVPEGLIEAITLYEPQAPVREALTT